MALAPGDQLGPYTIAESLGKGGMGEVFKAHDTRLDRTVAIKQAASEFSERFEREARTIATLNHPHICSLYDVGAAPDGSGYLVMEYVEGRMPHGPMPLTDALRYARQILDALEAAHSKGIVHRDLKPENILIAENGVKILDFGIAKLTQSPETESGAQNGARPTIASLTSAGAMIGTLQYMSPEQIEGQPADARSDIFAFGLVLYELITGERPFKGQSEASLIAAILKDTPRPIHEIKPVAPRALDRIIATCLAKDPGRRWQSARDVERALELVELDGRGDTAAASVPGARWLWPAATALLGLIAVAAIAVDLWPAHPQLAVTRFQVPIPEGVTFAPGRYVRLAPDGRKLAFTGMDATGQVAIWVHDFGTGTSRRIPGTEGTAGPFWSPDSKYLAFGVGMQLKKVSIDGDPPQVLAVTDNNVGSGFWTPDGRIVFGGLGTGPLHVVSAAGGEPRELTRLDPSRSESFHSLPSLLPDGVHFLYYRNPAALGQGIYLGSLDRSPEEQGDEFVMEAQFGAVFVDSSHPAGGHILYLREGTLLARPFDVRALRLVGDPVRIAERVGAGNSHGHFSASANGVLAYRVGAGALVRMTWFDRAGQRLGTIGEPGVYRVVGLSPDESKAALFRGDTLNTGNIWILDLERDLESPLTFDNDVSMGPFVSAPVWAPDGQRIAYRAGSHVYEKSANGAGDARPVIENLGAPSDWSADGRFLVLQSTVGLKAFDLREGQAAVPLQPASRFVSYGAMLSADERWLAYISSESGGDEVWLRRVEVTEHGIELGDGKWQVSRNGGTDVRWRGDGRELLFRYGQGPIMAVDLDLSGDAPVFGPVTELFTLDAPQSLWDVTGDGQRFLAGVPVDLDTEAPIEVILDWEALLE